jgi:DNA repair photolyase
MTSLDEGFRKELEPHSASYERRITALKTLKDSGISTYLSCEPIIPVREADPIQIIIELKDIVDLFEFGMWNKYRTQNIPEGYYRDYSDDYYVQVFKRIISYCEENKINYCLASHSKDFIQKHELPFRPYPLVKS